MGYEEQRLTYLVSDDGLLDSSQVLEGREENMAKWRATDVLDEGAELLTQSNQNLVLVLDRFYRAGLGLRATRRQGQQGH